MGISETDDQRRQQAEGHGEGLVTEQLAGNALDEHDGQEHRHGGQGARRHRRAHLAGALHHGAGQGQALLTPPGDGLEHDDGVVHQHADAQGQPTEGHEVQGHVELVEQDERRDHREGNRHGDDEGRAHVAQEQVQHDHGQQAADERGVTHLADGLGDEHRLVEQDVQIGARRQLGAP